MSITGIIMAAVVVGGTGLFIGLFLGFAGKKFAVEVDEREEAIVGVLPGNNCGGCGYAGCSGLAAAIVKGEAEISGCPVGGAPVAAKIGEIMGQEAGAQVHQVAFVKCAGTCSSRHARITRNALRVRRQRFSGCGQSSAGNGSKTRLNKKGVMQWQVSENGATASP